MPELPEVETTRRGIEPEIHSQIIDDIIIRNGRLRWPVDSDLAQIFKGYTISEVERRSKYLLLQSSLKDKATRTIIIHLGMSGSLHIISPQSKSREIEKHDHVDFRFHNGTILRYRDPRRFGSILWCEGDPLRHRLLKSLGPEPLSKDFDIDKFYKNSRGRKQTIKQYIMDASHVVGVGNIYASEALFLSKIRPGRACGRVTYKEFVLLKESIINVLSQAIEKGGTTLKDFVAPVKDKQAQPGYFQLELSVYGQAGKPCKVCKNIIKEKKIGQRNSFYCPLCQH